MWWPRLLARVVVEVVGQGGGRGCWPGWWQNLMARVVAKVVGLGGGRLGLLARVEAEVVGQDGGQGCCPVGVGQVEGRVGAGVSAGVAPPVCRSGSGGTPHCEDKKVLKSNFKML